MKLTKIMFLTVLVIFVCCIGIVSASDDMNTLSANSTDVIGEISSDFDVSDAVEEVDDTSDEPLTLDSDNPSTDFNLQESSQKISVNASDWDELKTYCEKTDGDYIIHLEPKKYTIGSSDIQFKNNVEIIGTTNCFISGIANNRVPFKSAENSNLNVTLRNVLFSNINSYMLIQLETHGVSIIENCTFRNVIVGQSKNSVVYNTLGTMYMINSSFIGSSAGYGVLSNYNPSTVKNVIMYVRNCYFENNFAQVEPGSINNCGILTVENTTFKNNRANWWAGAIHTHIGANTTIYNSQFIGNVAGWNGGALYTYSYLAVYNSTFIGNNCTTDLGGGAIGATYGDCAPDVHIEGCVFEDNNNNHASGYGGAISITARGKMEIHNTTFIQNSAAKGTAIFASANGTYGSPSVIITESTFINHTRAGNLLIFNLEGTNATVANNTYINNAIPYDTLYLNVSEAFDRKVNVTIAYSLKNPEYYDSDILSRCSYDIYIDGKYSRTITENVFTLNFEDIETCRVYAVPSIYSGSTPEVTITVPRNFIYVSQSRGSNENDGLTSDTPVKTIDKAIKLAASCENIILMDGVFSEENLTVDYRLTIWGSDQSSIGGFDIADTMISVENAKFTLRNLTINDLGMSSSLSRFIKGDSASRVYLTNCIVKDNLINTLIDSQTLGITDTLFENNRLSIKANNLTIFNSSFDNNTVNNNDGFFNSADAADWNIADSTFTNSHDLKNGLLSYYSASSTLKIENSLFENNTASSQASCIVIGDGAKLSISSSTVRHNSESLAVIYKGSAGSSIDIKNSIILNAGDIIMGDSSNIDCNCNWWGNTYENKEIRPNLNSQIQLDNWLFLSMTYPDEIEMDVNYTLEIALDNLITKDGAISTYNNYDLPAIVFSINYSNVTVNLTSVSLDNGKAEINFSLNNPTNGSLSIIYDDVVSTANFKFAKTDPTRQITANDVLVGEEGLVEITFPGDLTGEVTVHVDGFNQKKVINASTITFNIAALAANNYTLTVSYSGDSKYSSFVDEIAYRVNKRESHAAISIGEASVYENVTITVNVDNGATGNVTLNINGKDYNLLLNNSKAVYIIENIAPGDWTINARYNGDDNYLPSEDNRKFSVGKQDVSVNIQIDDIVFGQDAFLEIAMNENATGNVTVSVDSISKTDSLKNGKVNFTLSDLNAGDKRVKINYTGDKHYNEATFNVNFYIDKASTKVNVTAVGAKAGKDIRVEIAIPKGGNGKFTITVEDIREEVDVPLDGKYTWTTSALGVGTHTVKVTYKGDNYFTCSNSTDVVVLAWDEPQWPNEGYDNCGKSPYESNVNGNLEWSAQLTGIVSNNIVIDSEGNIYAITSDGIYSFDNTGKIRWNFSSRSNEFSGLAIGRDVIVSTISGDTLYLINQTTGEKYGASNIWQASSAFAPVIDKNANIYISGDQNADTGHYSLVIVPYSAWETGNDIISIDLGTSKPTAAPVLVMDNIVCVGCEDGLKLVNIKTKSVISSLNIVADARPVVGDGNIVYAIAGGKVFAVDSAGNQLWSSSSKITNAKYLAIDDDNNILYGLDSENKLYKYDLLDSGKETLVSTGITSGILIGSDGTIYAGMNAALVALNGDGKFLWKSETPDEIISTPVMDKDGVIYAIGNNKLFAFTFANLTDLNIVMTPENMDYGSDSKLKFAFADDATGNISISIGDEIYAGEINDGLLEISIPKLNAGKYDVKIKYSGDKRYLASQITKELNISKIDIPNFKLTVPNVLYDNKPTFSFSFPSYATGSLTVSVDGKKYSENIVNGRVSVTIPKLNAGTHNIVISYSGNQNYNSIKTSKSVVIYPIKITGNRDINVDYGVGCTYSVRVWGVDGKNVAGGKVIFKFNKKSISVKTNKKGYASLKINELPKRYTITATYNGKTVKNVINVKQILKASNIKIKKSAKKLVLKATLKLSSGKAVKNKLIKFKFNGKTYKAKTNKKGLAKVTLDKKAIKKLKVKKYPLKITYIKDTIKKTVKITK